MERREQTIVLAARSTTTLIFIIRITLEPSSALVPKDDVACWYELNCGPSGYARRWRNGGRKLAAAGNGNDGAFVWYEQNTNGKSVDQSLKDPGIARNLSMIRNTSKVVMVLEGNADNVVWAPVAYGYSSRIAGRHGQPLNQGKDGLCNMAFFDGHVSAISTVPFTKALSDPIKGASAEANLSCDRKEVIFYLDEQ